MIRAFSHGSFPKVGDSPLDQQLRAVLRRRERGKATAAEVALVADEVTSLAVAEQARAFIDVVSDGGMFADGPHAQLVGPLAGLERRGIRRWFETCFYDRDVAVVGPIRRARPFLVRGYEVAASVAPHRRVKVSLPGPVTFARRARDEHYGSPEAVAEALADALAEEVAALRTAGARFFQLDEPLLCRMPEDAELVSRTALVVFDAAGEGATTVLSTFFGDLFGVADGSGLDALPGTHLGLDLTGGAAALALLGRLPAERGVALGVFDATTTVQEDAADMTVLLEPYREVLMARDVMVGPNAGLELLPRDAAFDKLLHARYLVEKLAKDWAWES